MHRPHVLDLVEFNFWAGGRILDACERLVPVAFTDAVAPDPGWGSVRGILVHILDTEWGWRAALAGTGDDVILEASDFPNVATVRARWEIERDAWLRYVAGLTDDDLRHGYGGDPNSGPQVWQTIVHVVTHGIQHRSEVAVVLSGHGVSPGDLDFDVFLSDHQ